MKQKLLDELGAPGDENLLCATVSKQWTLHCFVFFLPVKPPSNPNLPLPECDCTLTQYEVWDEFIRSLCVVQKVDSEPLITAVFFFTLARECVI